MSFNQGCPAYNCACSQKKDRCGVLKLPDVLCTGSHIITIVSVYPSDLTELMSSKGIQDNWNSGMYLRKSNNGGMVPHASTELADLWLGLCWPEGTSSRHPVFPVQNSKETNRSSEGCDKATCLIKSLATWVTVLHSSALYKTASHCQQHLATMLTATEC